jgi:Dyp-type peroxidase family
MERLELDDIQGIVAYSYLSRKHACYVLLKVVPERAAQARALLRGLQAHVPHAKGQRGQRAGGPVLSIAFTYAGLAALGVDLEGAGFVPEFQQGMVHPHRSRVLGDIDDNSPAHWRWGSTNDSVHILVAVYAEQRGAITDFVDTCIGRAVAAGSVEEVYRRDAAFRPRPENPRDLREPFGFRDGISQPYVEGFERPAPIADAPSNRVRAGEFVLGYPNELGRSGLSPRVEASADPDGLLPQLPDGRRDLGRNGTYLVVREFDQDVAAFNALDPTVQAKLIGRWPSGAPVALSPECDQSALADRNDFGYAEADPAGLRCPLGAHVRRSNPRDGFADPDLPLTAQESLASVNTHRLLRRGRPFSEKDREGTFFVCINANIERQFEFVQHAWLAAPGFMGLRGERDIAAGVATPFTIPHCAGFERVKLPSMVRVRGGAYFLLPGLRALRWISSER